MTGMSIIGSEGEEAVTDPNPRVEHHDYFHGTLKPLDVVGRENLYDFLAMSKVCNEDQAALRAMDAGSFGNAYGRYVDDIRAAYKNERTEVSTNVQNLCQMAGEIFGAGGKYSKEEYDRFLVWQRKNDIISDMIAFADSDRQLSPAQSSLFRNELVGIEGSRKKAEKVFRAICDEEGLSAAPDSGDPVPAASNQGEDAYYLMASTAIASMDLKNAETYVNMAEQLFPGSYRISGLRRDLDAQKKKLADFNAMCRRADDAILRKDFAEAASCADGADKLFPDSDRVRELREKLARQRAAMEFEMFCTKAEEALAGNDFQTAMASIDEAERLIPGNSRTDRLRQQLEEQANNVFTEMYREADRRIMYAQFNEAKVIVGGIEQIFGETEQTAALRRRLEALQVENHRKRIVVKVVVIVIIALIATFILYGVISNILDL